MSERLDRLRAALAENELDALLVSVPVDDGFGRHADNRKYISGFTGSSGIALITAQRALFAADFRYTEQAERECVPRGFEVFEALGNSKDWMPRLLLEARLSGKKLGVSQADMSLAGWSALQQRVESMQSLDRPQLLPAPQIIETLRRHKDAEEMALLQRAIDIADASFEALQLQLSPKLTEVEVEDLFEAGVLAEGAESISFETIVAAGAWGAMPHAHPRDGQRIGEGQPIVIDMGAQYQGYCSDLTRTVVVGEPNAKFREIYGIVFEAQRRAIEGVRPGMTGVDAHNLAANVIAEHGYGERFGHGLGHGVGLQVHEAPYIGLSSEDILEEGMVFTIEPGIYLPGWGGVRIEDIVVLESSGARILSHASKLTPAGV
ncbi:MAG: aminopeptidase P family protein [Tepidiformaceae bacterium]